MFTSFLYAAPAVFQPPMCPCRPSYPFPLPSPADTDVGVLILARRVALGSSVAVAKIATAAGKPPVHICVSCHTGARAQANGRTRVASARVHRRIWGASAGPTPPSATGRHPSPPITLEIDAARYSTWAVTGWGALRYNGKDPDNLQIGLVRLVDPWHPGCSKQVSADKRNMVMW